MAAIGFDFAEIPAFVFLEMRARLFGDRPFGVHEEEVERLAMDFSCRLEDLESVLATAAGDDIPAAALLASEIS